MIDAARSTSRRWFLVLIVALLTIAPRFYHLGERPLMHDEAQDAFFSYGVTQGNHYTFSPILHGPFIHESMGYIFRVFGDTAAVARGYMAVCSLVMLAAMLLLVPRRARLAAGLLLGVSPLLLFYSRFFRAEMLFNAFYMVGLLGIVRALSPGPARGGWAALGVFSLVALLAIKINAIFIYASGLTFIIAWSLVRTSWSGPALALRMSPGRRAAAAVRARGSARRAVRAAAARRDTPVPSASSGSQVPWEVWLGWAVGAALGAAFVIVMYGVTGKEAGKFTPIDNLKDMWAYWFGQHSVQRIPGPLHFHLPVLIVYEAPMMILLAAGLFIDALRSAWRGAIYAVALGIWYCLWKIWKWNPPVFIDAPRAVNSLAARAFHLLHLEPNGSMFVLGAIIVPLIIWSILMLKEHRPLASWMGWWAACSLFQYSSAGEKVPWLAIYILMPFYMTVAWMWAPRLRRLGRAGAGLAALVVIASGALACWIDWPLLGRSAADPAEVILYNHTTPEFQRFCEDRIARWKESSSRIDLKDRNVVLSGQCEMTAYWYFRHCHVYTSESTDANTDLLLADEATAHSAHGFVKTPADWIEGRLELRSAWISSWPDPPAFAAWWHYYWTREPWSATGGTTTAFLEPVKMRQ